MTIKRDGSAVWSGGIKDGKGQVSTGSGATVLADRSGVLRQGVRRHGTSSVETFSILS